MFQILHTARAVLYRATVVSYTYSPVVLHSYKFRWKNTACVVFSTQIGRAKQHKFVRKNLKPEFSAIYMKRFTNDIYNVEATINPVVKERITESIAEWNDYAIEKQFIGELINGTMTLNEVIYIVSLMLDNKYVPTKLIETVFNLSLDHFDKLVHIYDQACGLMLLASICSSKVPNKFFVNMHNYLERNIDMFSMKEVSCFYSAFGKGNWMVAYSLNQEVVSKMVEEMLNLRHNEILQILNSLIVSTYYDEDAVKKIATSLMENDKIHSLKSEKPLLVYLRFFISRDYFDEALYDSLLQNFYSLATSSQISLTNIKFTSRVFSCFGRIQFKPNNKLHREISEVIERICLDTEFKPGYFSDYYWISEFANGMIFFGFFSDNLLGGIFTSIDKIPENNLSRQQLLFLHYSILIEHPNYNGPTFPQHFIRDLEIASEEYIRSMCLTKKGDNLDTIYSVLLDMLGPNCVHLYKILPHLNFTDIEIRLKYDGSVVAFEPETFLQRAASDLDEKKDLDVFKTIIIHLGRSSFLTGSPEIKGYNSVRIRQLRRLGYHVLMVKKNELSDLPTLEERKAFMTKLIESSFDVKLKLAKKEGIEICSF